MLNSSTVSTVYYHLLELLVKNAGQRQKHQVAHGEGGGHTQHCQHCNGNKQKDIYQVNRPLDLCMQCCCEVQQAQNVLNAMWGDKLYLKENT